MVNRPCIEYLGWKIQDLSAGSILPNFRFCYFKHEKISAWTKAWELIAERNELFDVGDWTTLLQNICSSNWNSSPKFRVFKRLFAVKPTVAKISTAFITAPKTKKRQVATVVSSTKPSHHANSGDQALVLRLCNRMLPASPCGLMGSEFFLKKLAPHGLTRQRDPGNYDANSLSLSLSLSLCIYIYTDTCMHAYVYKAYFFPVSWYHDIIHLVPWKNAFTICFNNTS